MVGVTILGGGILKGWKLTVTTYRQVAAGEDVTWPPCSPDSFPIKKKQPLKGAVSLRKHGSAFVLVGDPEGSPTRRKSQGRRLYFVWK